MTVIDNIIIHCAASPNGKPLGGEATSAAAIIDGWHQQRGFLRRAHHIARFNRHLHHIGYHFVIDIDGGVETGRQIGEQGAHVKGHNQDSIGICLIGTDKFTHEQWCALATLVKRLSKAFANATLHGHRDFSPDLNGDGQIEADEWLKLCPGFDVTEWVDNDLAPWPEHVCTGET